MSLINKVLKELESRRAGDEQVALNEVGVRPVPAPPAKRKATWLWLGALTAVSAAAFLTIELPGFSRPASERSAPRAQVVKNETKAAVNVTVPAGPSAPSATSVPSEPSGPSLPAVPAPETSQAQDPLPSEPVRLVEGSLQLSTEISEPIVEKAGPAEMVPDVATGKRPSQQKKSAGANSQQIASDTAMEEKSADLETAPIEVHAQAPQSAQVRAPVQPRPAPKQRERKLQQVAYAEPVASIEKSVREPSNRERAEESVEAGLVAMQRNSRVEAQALFRNAVKIDPSHDRGRQALLSLLLEAGEKSDAEALADEGVERGGARVQFGMIAARLKLERGSSKEAIALLEKVGSEGANYPDFLGLWGNALAREHRYAESARLYEAAIALAPENPVHHVGLGYSLRNDGQYSAAYGVFQGVDAMQGVNPQLTDLVRQQLDSLRRLVMSSAKR